MGKELTREDEKLLYEAGYLLLQKGNIKAAREVFEGVVALTPNKATGYSFLGNTYFAESKFDEALKLHRKAVELDPDSAVCWALLGESLYVTKQRDEAISVLKKALNMDPNGHAGKMAKGFLQLLDAG